MLHNIWTLYNLIELFDFYEINLSSFEWFKLITDLKFTNGIKTHRGSNRGTRKLLLCRGDGDNRRFKLRNLISKFLQEMHLNTTSSPPSYPDIYLRHIIETLFRRLFRFKGNFVKFLMRRISSQHIKRKKWGRGEEEEGGGAVQSGNVNCYHFEKRRVRLSERRCEEKIMEVIIMVVRDCC